MTYCCENFKNHIEYKCVQHDDPWDCPDYVIVKVDEMYGLPIRDGGSSFVRIDNCPWCGATLTSQPFAQETQQVVINTAIGGFGLSDFAIVKLFEMGSEFLKKNPYGDPNENPARYDEIKVTATHYVDGVRIELADDYHYHNQSRICPLLIQLLEEHGSELVSGEYSKLEIIKIPKNVKFCIQENEMGREWVSEKSRSWDIDN